MKFVKISILVLSAVFLLFMGYLFAMGSYEPDTEVAQPVLQSVATSPEPLEIDTRNPDDLQKLDEFMEEYCKKNTCASPFPTPTISQNTHERKKANLDEKTFCWVEKNGSFEMTIRECLEIYNADSFKYMVKAYQHCLEGKNPTIGDSGSPESRKQVCSDLTGITEK